MITPYYGEFLLHPIPLEVSFGDCSNNCGYCFVKLNGSNIDRSYSHNSLVNMLVRKDERKTLAAFLLAEGYPVLISNRSDPFSDSVWPRAKAALEIMTEMGIRAAFQTKGCPPERLDELLEIIDYPAHWYVTITTLAPEISHTFEPGAPDPAARLAMVERLTSLGHAVAIGLNPCVPEWHGNNADDLLKCFSQAGAHGIWVEELHLSGDQKSRMPAKAQTKFGKALLERAMQKYMSPHILDYFLHLQDLADQHQLDFQFQHHALPTNFFDPIRRLYPKTFPIYHDAIRFLHQKHDEDAVLDFGEFMEAFTSRTKFPESAFNLHNYVASTNRWDVLRNNALNLKSLTFQSLMKLFVLDERIKRSPANNSAFAMLIDDRDGQLIVDEKTRIPYLFFSKAGELYDPFMALSRTGYSLDD